MWSPACVNAGGQRPGRGRGGAARQRLAQSRASGREVRAALCHQAASCVLGQIPVQSAQTQRMHLEKTRRNASASQRSRRGDHRPLPREGKWPAHSECNKWIYSCFSFFLKDTANFSAGKEQLSQFKATSCPRVLLHVVSVAENVEAASGRPPSITAQPPCPQVVTAPQSQSLDVLSLFCRPIVGRYLRADQGRQSPAEV